MLWEPGPISFVPDTAMPTPGPPSNLAGVAAQLGVSIDAAATSIGDKLATMAGGWTSRVEGSAGADLNEAMAAHAGQAHDPDPSIGAVAGNVDAQGVAIVGLSNEAADVIAQAVEPTAPAYLSHGPEPTWPIGEGPEPTPPEQPPPPGGTVADLIISYYQRYLRRTPSTPEINNWSVLWPNQDAIEHGILYSNENADKVNALYEQYLERGVTGAELDEHRSHRDSLDDIEDQLQSRA